MKENSSKQLPAFTPAPWCTNGHLHTIFTSVLSIPAYVDYDRKYIDTPDGDILELDMLENTAGSPVTILIHGLESSTRRYYIQNLARYLYDHGYTVAAVNLRSCGGNLNSKRRFYHSGETEDLKTICNWLKEQYPDSIQLAAGFSLGGSILLNYLKKYPDQSKIYGFAGISVPYDLYQGSVNLQKGFNRIYDYRFLRTLRKKLKMKQKQFSDLPDFKGTTLFEFDDQVTAPIHGFDNAKDYYKKCSSAFFMDQIKTPGLLIHSEEDPLCPFSHTPTDAIFKNPYLTPVFTKKGGHVGFWSLPTGWIELTIEKYFSQILKIRAQKSFRPSLSLIRKNSF